ncbi:FbpB family small basic protein [Peribacillus sp. NPDC094092]|uniref:FbpB family small basic protein n=1 Tax=Peribacillus sp. NPDC094092 TaxID=3390611 RepID=UPI003D06A817
MRKNVSLAQLIESNKENLNNNQIFIDHIEEKVASGNTGRHVSKQGDENVIKKSLVLTTNNCLS